MKLPLSLRTSIARRTKARMRRLLFEQLERRELLANVSWNVDADGFWDVATNWSSGAVPGPADDVFLDRAAGNFTITHGPGDFAVHSIHASQVALVAGSGVLTIGAASELRNFSFASLILNGSLTTSGAVNWSPGPVPSPGNVSTPTTITSPFDEQQTNGINHKPIYAFINTGTMTLAGPGDWSLRGEIINSGTIIQTGGNLTLEITQVPGTLVLNPAVFINQATGVYSFQGEGFIKDPEGIGGAVGFQNFGKLSVSSGFLRLRSRFSSFGTSQIEVADNSTLDIFGAAFYSGAALTAGQGSLLRLADVFLGSGVWTGSGKGVFQFDNVGGPGAIFNFPAGLLHAGSALNFAINLGYITVDGTTINPGGGTILGTSENRGTIVQRDAGSLDLRGIFTNAQGGVYEIQNDNGITTSRNAQSQLFLGKFVNLGTIRKSAGAGTSTIGVLVDNQGGTLDVQTGILALTNPQDNGPSNDGGTFASGFFHVAAGSFLDLSRITYSGMFTGSGTGLIRLSTLVVGPTGSTFDFNGQWINGSWTLGSPGLLNRGTLRIAGADRAFSGVFSNSGTITHAGPGTLTGETFNNLADGLYDLQGDLALNCRVNNSGIFRKSSGAGTSTLNHLTNLGGTIDVRSGTLGIDGKMVAEGQGPAWTGGNFQVAAGSILNWSGENSFIHYSLTGTYTGFGGGVVQMGTSGGNELFVAGSGGATFNFPSGLLQWVNGHIDGGASGLTNQGYMTLAGSAEKNVFGTIKNRGTIAHAVSADLVLRFGSTLINEIGAVYDLRVDQSVRDTATFINRGTLRKSGGTGTSSILSTFHNENGTIDVRQGVFALNLNTGDSANGTFNVAKDAVLDLSSQGTPIYAGIYTGVGEGIVRLRTIGFPGAYGFGLDVTGATFNFPAGMFQWMGGTLHGGTTGFNNTGSITLAGPDDKFLRGVLNNAGTIVHGGAGGLVFAAPNTVLNNLAGSLYDFQGDSNLSGSGGGYTTFNNAGTLRKSAGAGISANNGVDLQNLGGTIDVQSGEFRLKPSINPAAASTGGIFRVAKGALLTLIGAGAFSHQVLRGNYSGSGEGLVALTTGTLQVGAGGATFDFPPRLFQWIGGAIDGRIAPLTNRGTIALDVGIEPFLVGALNNAGTIISIDAGDLYFQGHGGTGTLTNLPGGVFEFQGGGGSVAPQAGNTDETRFINQGTLRKSGPGTATIDTTLFSNTGTVVVDGGTLRIQSSTITQVVGNTLTAGAWQASAGGSIDLVSAPPLTANSAKVTLDGPGPNFPKLDALATNSGSLTLLNDRDFTTVGPLTNSGSLTVGASSTLNVTGTYAQTATGTLSVQLGGDAGSGKFGKLASSGAATLDGTFGVSLINGFGPATGQRFEVMSFPEHTGTFSGVAGLSQGRFPLFTLAVNSVNVELNTLANGTDLAFDSFQSSTFPAHADPGQTVNLTYTVKNLSDPAIAGDWIDSIYLSRDGVLDPSDALLARVEHRGGVASKGSYSETATAVVPPLANGAYRVIVLADSRGLASDADRGNNMGVSAQAINLTVPLLTLGTPASGTLAPGQDRYYRVLIAPGAEVTLAADFPALPGAEVSIRYGEVSDQTNRDDAAPAGQLHSRLLLSNVQGGTYYIRLHAREDGGSVPFTLTAAASGFEITSVSPLRGSNQFFAPAIITVQGARFTPQTQLQIRQAGGPTRAAQSVEFISANKVVAKVDLLDLPIGNYEVVAEDAGQTAIAFDTFTVTDKDNGGTGAWISALSFVKVGGPIILRLGEYNTSDNPVTAPLILIKATDVGDPGADDTTGSLTIDTLPGSLPGPYSKIYDPFKIYGTSSFPGTSTFSLSIVEFAQTPAEWDSQKAALRPATIPPDAWDAVWDNFRPQLSETLSDFFQFLTITALKLKAASGELVEKIDTLFNFELQKANNLPAVPVPAGAVDIAFPAPGLPLVFGRSMGDAIAGRYQLGRLGRGWIDNFDISIHEDAVTHLLTVSQGGGVRYFKGQDDGSYRGAVGEVGTLTKLSGAFQLREKTGELMAFRADGLLDFLADANGNRITAGYTGSQLTTLTNSNGAALTLTYAGSRLHQVTDPAGGVATYEYDASGEHLIRVTTTAGTTEYAYTPDANGPRAHALASITFLDGTHLFFDYDSHGRLVRRQGDGGAATVRYSYDSASYTVTDAQNHATTFFYDDSLRVRRVVDPLGAVTTIQYDASNRPVIVGANGGGKGVLGYDALGNPTSVQNPLGESQAFTYGASHSELATWKDALGNKTQFDHDAKGNLTATTQADGSTQQYSYDTQGNVVATVNRLGQTIRFTYNSRGQVTRKELPGGATVEYTYNSRGNPVTVVDADGTMRLEYLDANPDLLTKITYPTGRFLEYTYHNGQRTRMVDQSGFTINYSYDAVGRLDVLRDGSNGVIVDYDYDSLGRLARETRGNFTATLYAYDNAGQLLEITHRASDASIQSQIIYTYDTLGRRTSAKTDGALTTYGYDGVGRLTSVKLPAGRVISYAYDAEGNRTISKDNGATASYTVNDLNQYVAIGSNTQAFDAAGNLVSTSGPGGSTSYRYDAEGRLVSQITPAGTWTYQYDALGNRIASTHDGVRTEYLVDPSGLGNLVGEYDGAGNLQAHYVDGIGLTSRVNATGTAAYYQFDAVGNTTQLTGAGGVVLNSYSYLPFGESLGSSETVANPFEYVGRFGVMREGGGIDYMRNRWYAPAQGRFTQQDPIGLAGGTNGYAYVDNNPISGVDPAGLSPFASVALLDAFLGLAARFAPALLGPVAEAAFQAGLPLTLAGMEGTGLGGLPGLNANALGNGVGEIGGVSQTAFAQGQAQLERHLAQQAAERASQAWTTGAMRQLATIGRGGLWGLGLAAIVYSSGVHLNVLYQGNYFFRTGQMAPCTPGIPHFLQACEDPGSDLLEEILELRFLQRLFVTRVGGSKDPNDIVGPAGFGPQGFVVPQITFPYLINFQNLPAADAPAAQIVVTHVLDADLDLDTFALEDFGLGGITFPVPAGRQSYSTRLDLRSTRGVFVDVVAGLDRVTRTVTWKLQALDPETLDLPISPIVGFLPPDKVAPEGEGFVSFSARAKAGLPSGTAIKAQASIVFDTNAAIDTNIASNMLDIAAPTSSVKALTPKENESFTLRWAGLDEVGGSGITSYDVYMSDNGSDFTRWQSATTATSAIFNNAIPKHTYRFYAVATDNVGHVETIPATPDTQTVISDNPWQNAEDRRDVDHDTFVVASDVLAVINYINAVKSGPLPGSRPADKKFVDVNGDRSVAADDVLDIINYINARPNLEGESIASTVTLASPVVSQQPIVNDPLLDADLLALLAFDIASQPKRRRW